MTRYPKSRITCSIVVQKMVQWNHSIWVIWINEVTNMRVRIHQNCSGGLYWGQVYNEKHKRWEDVTSSYITKWGCKRELNKWIRRQKDDEGYEV